MASTAFEIVSYELALTRERSDVVALVPPPDVNWTYGLVLRSADGRPRAYVYFCERRKTLPANRYLQNEQVHVLFLSEERFGVWIDILRNEKPIYIIFDPDQPEHASLQSQPEPVGEGEDCCVVEGAPAPAPVPVVGRDWRPFAPNATANSLENLVNAYLLSLASFHVYGSGAGSQPFDLFFRSLSESWLAPGSSTPPRFDYLTTGDDLPLTGLQVVVMSNSSFVVVVFRGSELNAADWPTNLAAVPTPVDPLKPLLGFAHGGWVLQVASVYGSLQTLIDSHSGSFVKPIWITGHSLGGALGCILAQGLAANGHLVQGVTTFAAPSHGDVTYVSAYTLSGLGRRTQRWVNNADVLPWVPIPSLGLTVTPFFHPTYEYEFLTDGGAVVFDMMNPLAPDGWPSLVDHEAPRYCGKLFGNIPPDRQQALPVPPPT